MTQELSVAGNIGKKMSIQIERDFLTLRTAGAEA
jgi:hypothetical protein